MEITIETLIKARYSGGLEEISQYMNLTIQTVAVLVAGIIIWRISAIAHRRKKAQRERNSYFSTPYSEGWKRK